MTQERITVYENIRKDLTAAPLLLIPDWNIRFILYIDACGGALGAALHQVKIIDDKPTGGPVCYISRQIKPTEARYGASQMECSCLLWALEKLHYYLHGSAFEVITDCISLKLLLNMKTPNRRKIHKNADGFSRWELANTPDNPAYVPLEEEAEIPIEGLNITDIETEFFEEVREYYKKDNNLHILTSLLDKD
ncbi:hypothetical protein O181_030260 [Austropuccinia psidii MF-1]|uniref:Reverse transcriptase RNase H-like domain-containing protein n=1 Tax=Austropuccinia psidii MF-1 TaxID=1389203 RepID=A0A9Q3CVY6_9BASI|nr:hypothetical protein [Austropuccinia psidii MF-1]